MRIFIAIAVLTLSACAGLPPTRPVPPKIQAYTIPELGQEVTVAAGTPLLRIGQRVTMNAIVVTHPVQIGLWKIMSGDYLVTEASSEGARFAPLAKADSRWSPESSGIGNSDYPPHTLEWNSVGLCIFFSESHGYKMRRCTDRRLGQIETVDVPDRRVWERRLIWNGRAGTEMRVGYREFQNDLARAAYSNEALFDLKASRKVTYAGAVIEILAVSNRGVRYRVLSPFDDTESSGRDRRIGPASMDRLR